MRRGRKLFINFSWPFFVGISEWVNGGVLWIFEKSNEIFEVFTSRQNRTQKRRRLQREPEWLAEAIDLQSLKNDDIFWIPNYFLSLSTHSIRFFYIKKYNFNTTEMMVLFFVWQSKNAGPDIWATLRWESSSCRGDLSRFLESVSLIFNKFEEIFYDNFILQKREN